MLPFFATLISAAALPLAIIPTFWALHIFGFSLNTMSMLALSLVVGMLVDDAIVEVENIVRHLRMGKTPYQAAMEAAYGKKEFSYTSLESYIAAKVTVEALRRAGPRLTREGFQRALDTIGSYDGTPLITISDHTTYPTSGNLNMTTVSERGGPFGSA